MRILDPPEIEEWPRWAKVSPAMGIGYSKMLGASGLNDSSGQSPNLSAGREAVCSDCRQLFLMQLSHEIALWLPEGLASWRVVRETVMICS